MSKERTYHNQEPDTSHIDKLADKGSFKTPEGYFDSFPGKMAEMAQATSAAPVSSSLWQQLASHPWMTAAAAAAVTGLIVATVILSGGDGINSPDEIKDKPALVENDSSKTERKQQESSDNDTTPGQKKQVNPETKTQDNFQKQQPVNPADEKDDPAVGSEEKGGDKNNSKSHRDPEKHEYKPQTPEQYAQEQVTDQSYPATENKQAVVADAGNSGTQDKGEAKLAVATRNSKTDFIIADDTCISEPTWLVLPEAPRGYKFIWEHDTENDSLLVNESGEYSAVMFDADGEVSGRDKISVKYLPAPELSLKPRYTVCVNKNLKLDPGFYSEEYDFNWSDGVKSPVNFVSSLKERHKVYVLTVRGCESYTQKTLVVFDPCDLEIPNVITPNGDGINDRFVIEGLEKYPGSELVIYDRNNNIIFQSNDYTNDFKGTGLEEGVYYFILKLNSNTRTVKKGTLHIVY